MHSQIRIAGRKENSMKATHRTQFIYVVHKSDFSSVEIASRYFVFVWFQIIIHFDVDSDQSYYFCRCQGVHIYQIIATMQSRESIFKVFLQFQVSIKSNRDFFWMLLIRNHIKVILMMMVWWSFSNITKGVTIFHCTTQKHYKKFVMWFVCVCVSGWVSWIYVVA